MTQSTQLSKASQPLHVVRPDEGVLGSLRILAGSEQTGGLYFAFESETAPAEPGSALDLHAHDEYDESEYVVTGEREIVVEDQRWKAGSGLFVLAPRRTRHSMRTVGSAPSRWLHFFSPAGLERYFVERERMRAAGASGEDLRALSERHRSSSPVPRWPADDTPFAAGVSAHRVGVVAGGEHTRNAYALAEWSTLPDHAHVHEDQEEAFYVISGELVVDAEGAHVAAPARSFVVVRRGLRHRHAISVGTSLLAVFSPGHTVPHEL